MLSFFFNNFSLAESALDYMGKKQSDMDENYECLYQGNNKNYRSYKKVKNKLFKYNYWSDAEARDGTMGSTGSPDSVVKKFERNINNNEITVYMDFTPVPKEANLQNGIILAILLVGLDFL